MKIGNSNNPLPFAPGLNGKARPSTEKSDSNMSSTAASGISENVGTASPQLRSVSSTATMPINALKLAEIKQAISEGRLQTNSSAVAEGLIKSVVDLISTRQTILTT